MCENPNICWLVKDPKPFFGRFIIRTKQYNEYAQYGKEYILFKSDKNYHYVKRFRHVQDVCLPCGKCPQCVTARSKSWTIRSSLELQNFNQAVCLTLTYDNDHLPEDGLLQYKDFQLFMKRLRKKLGSKVKLKYMVCGEYGKRSTVRPHYHAIIMGYFPPDVDLMKPYKITRKKTPLYKSKLLSDLWQNGFVDVGCVNHQTCRYISQYCCKKLVHNSSQWKKKNKIVREFLHASVGFGLSWFRRNYRQVIEAGKIVLGGYKFPIPRYFIKKLEQINNRVYTEFKEKAHRFFLNYKFTEEERLKQRNACDAIRGRLKVFSGKSEDDIFLDTFLHNI